jgi:hypothetical protein
MYGARGLQGRRNRRRQKGVCGAKDGSRRATSFLSGSQYALEGNAWGEWDAIERTNGKESATYTQKRCEERREVPTHVRLEGKNGTRDCIRERSPWTFLRRNAFRKKMRGANVAKSGDTWDRTGSITISSRGSFAAERSDDDNNES